MTIDCDTSTDSRRSPGRLKSYDIRCIQCVQRRIVPHICKSCHRRQSHITRIICLQLRQDSCIILIQSVIIRSNISFQRNCGRCLRRIPHTDLNVFPRRIRNLTGRCILHPVQHPPRIFRVRMKAEYIIRILLWIRHADLIRKLLAAERNLHHTLTAKIFRNKGKRSRRCIPLHRNISDLRCIPDFGKNFLVCIIRINFHF